MICGACQAEAQLTAPVAVILLFAPGLERPYPLIPAEDYQVCIGCKDAIFTLVTRAAGSHPLTMRAGHWTRALVICVDGKGYNVVDKTATQWAASA